MTELYAGLGRLIAVEQGRWSLTVYPEAGEAGGCFVAAGSSVKTGAGGSDPERARQEAARRARARVRRYCASNGLNRLGTLTYAVACHDQGKVRADVGVFFRRLREATGGKLFPYLWVPEWHPKGHGLHVHFAVGRYLRRSLIDQAWGHGFVHIKLLGDLPVGSGQWKESRKAGRYLSKYVSKAMEDARIAARHRYDVAQGFQPWKVSVVGVSEQDVLAQANDLLGSRYSAYWSSSEQEGWQGPPAVWVQWDG